VCAAVDPTELDLESCLACRIVEGDVVPPGGVVFRTHGFVVHGFAEKSPLPGWLVVTATRHTRAVYELNDVEAELLGPLTVQVMKAQRAALGAEHVYAFAIGDQLHHMHLHLVPRFKDTPPRLRGRGCFDFGPQDHAGDEKIEAAAQAVRAFLEAQHHKERE
jgi:diadenosine tetraphosphate (Ap4A) HIT family hydrolase